MSHPVTVSIIVPNYNHERYLQRRLESIFNQTFTDFEVILLDDASKDNSSTILKKYARYPQVSQYLVNEENSGSPFKQWKKGIDLAKGRFIWIAESDDWAEVQFLEKAIPVINEDTKIGIVSQESYMVNEVDEIIGTTNYSFKTPFLEETPVYKRYNGNQFLLDNMLYRSGIYNASGVLFRKRFVEDFADFANFRQAGDTLFWAKILLEADIVILKHHLNYFRKHENSVTFKNFNNNLIHILEMYQRIEFVRTHMNIKPDEQAFIFQKAFDRTIKHQRSLRRPILSYSLYLHYKQFKQFDPLFFNRLFYYGLSIPKKFTKKLFRRSKKIVYASFYKLLSMIKKVIQYTLGKLGYQLVKISTLEAEELENQEPNEWERDLQNYSIAETELSELSHDLIRFSEAFPNCIGKEAKGEVNWSDPAIVREYLTDWRIALFHEVLAQLKTHGITFDEQQILEVGSGTGYLLRLIQKESPSAKLTGYDTYQALNQLAQFLCPGVPFFEKDLFTKYEGIYDLIICMETLEHLLDPKLAIENMIAHLQPGGTLCLTVPNGRLDSLPSIGLFPNKKGYWGHINFWSIESWTVFLNNAAKDFYVEAKEIHDESILLGIIRNDR